MSNNNLTIDGEFRYIIQWFNEFSELQRDDFVPVLVEYLLQDASEAQNGDAINLNGMINSMTNADLSDRPMSLFQCRLKLFRQWTPKWPVEFKHKLQEKIIEMDPELGEKIMRELKSCQLHEEPPAIEDDDELNAANDIRSTAEAIVEATEKAINIDQRLAAAINYETCVDNGDDKCANGDNEDTVESVNGEGPGVSMTEGATTISNKAEVPLVA